MNVVQQMQAALTGQVNSLVAAYAAKHKTQKPVAAMQCI